MNFTCSDLVNPSSLWSSSRSTITPLKDCKIMRGPSDPESCAVSADESTG
jgi:hypothetical protein